MIYVIVIYFYIFQVISGVEIPLCTAVHYHGDVSIASVISTYDFDVAISYNETIAELPNEISLTNFNSTFTQRNTFIFHFGEHSIECLQAQDSSCETLFPNGKFAYSFFVSILGFKEIEVLDYIKLAVVDGVIFDGEQFLSSGNNECRQANHEIYDHEEEEDYRGNILHNNISTGTLNHTDNITVFQKACCTHYDNVTFPTAPNSKEICNSFKTEATITDYSKNICLTLNVLFEKQYISPAIYRIDYAVVNISGQFSSYQIQSLNDNICKEYRSEQCFHAPIDFTKEWQIETIFSIKISDDFEYSDIIIGELIIRDEYFYKNINVPFTPSDKCWNKTSSKIPFTNATIDASYCCVKFKEGFDVTTTTAPTTTKSLTTTIQEGIEGATSELTKTSSGYRNISSTTTRSLPIVITTTVKSSTSTFSFIHVLFLPVFLLKLELFI